MTTMMDEPLAPLSAHFPLVKLAPATTDTAAPAELCPRGLRNVVPVPAAPQLPEHTYDHQLQLMVDADRTPLIDTVPQLMSAKSYSNTDGQEDWKSGN